MNDLIDRQAAIAYAISGRTREFEGEKWIRVSEVRENIKTMPSAQSNPLTLRVNRELTKEEYDKLMQDIKDAPIMLLPSTQPEIIRCKDCKYWEHDAIFPDGWCRVIQQGNPEWFCADAERRTDE